MVCLSLYRSYSVFLNDRGPQWRLWCSLRRCVVCRRQRRGERAFFCWQKGTSFICWILSSLASNCKVCYMPFSLCSSAHSSEVMLSSRICLNVPQPCFRLGASGLCSLWSVITLIILLFLQTIKGHHHHHHHYHSQKASSSSNVSAAVHIQFKYKLTDNLEGLWSTVLYGKSLYVHIPTSTNGEGSKDSFVRLLEFAEEHLRCTNVVVFFQQERPDAGKNSSSPRALFYIWFTPCICVSWSRSGPNCVSHFSIVDASAALLWLYTLTTETCSSSWQCRLPLHELRHRLKERASLKAEDVVDKTSIKRSPAVAAVAAAPLAYLPLFPHSAVL